MIIKNKKQRNRTERGTKVQEPTSTLTKLENQKKRSADQTSIRQFLQVQVCPDKAAVPKHFLQHLTSADTTVTDSYISKLYLNQYHCQIMEITSNSVQFS